MEFASTITEDGEDVVSVSKLIILLLYFTLTTSHAHENTPLSDTGAYF